MEYLYNEERYINHMDKLICRYCGKECKNDNSLRNHERLCKLNPNRQESNFVKYNNTKEHAWNKGLTKETDERVRKYGETAHKKYMNGTLTPGFLNHKHTKETRALLSRIVREHHDKGIGHTWTSRTTEPSTPEKWLYQVLKDNGIIFQREVPFYGFFLDVVVDDKVCIEIDGEQHYNKKHPEIEDRDRRKDKLLLENGWKELRIRFALVKDDEAKYKDKIVKFLQDNGALADVVYASD